MSDQKDKRPEETKDQDPMYVEKNYQDMEDIYADDGMYVAHADDAKINRLDAMSYEDHQQTFGFNPQTPEQAEAAEDHANQAEANEAQE